MFNQPRGGCLPPRPRGIIELALFQILPAHLVFPSEAHATHLAGGGRGRGWGDGGYI